MSTNSFKLSYTEEFISLSIQDIEKLQDKHPDLELAEVGIRLNSTLTKAIKFASVEVILSGIKHLRKQVRMEIPKNRGLA